MELRHIRYFLTAAEELNLTRAAERLCIAQPPLSRQIKDLEEELGAELFIRKPKGLALTEEGRHFRQYAEQILNLADQSAEEIRDLKKGLQGTLYLASVEGYAPHLLAGWISAFHEKYPFVEYTLWNGNSDDVAARVSKGLCDLGIVTAPYNEEEFEGTVLYKEPWIAIIPPGHPLALDSAGPVSLKELAPYDLIIPSRASRKKEIEGWFSAIGEEPHIIARVAHMVNAYELSEAGLGISIYPEAAASYAKNEICLRKLDPPVSASYVFIRSSESRPSLVASEFFSFVKENYLNTRDV